MEIFLRAGAHVDYIKSMLVHTSIREFCQQDFFRIKAHGFLDYFGSSSTIPEGAKEDGMTSKKRFLFFSAMGIILFLCGGYLTLDWYQFFAGIADIQRPEVPYVRATKVAVTFLTAFLVFLVGSDGFDRRDTLRLGITYGVICAGDIFLVFDVNLVGIGVFALSHVCFIARNGAGMGRYFALKSARNRLLDACTAIVILLIVICAMRLLYFPIMGGGMFFYIFLGYGLFLGISLWTAWAAVRTGFMPAPNAWLAAIGLTCFFLSDFTVGLNFSMKPGHERLISNYLTWVFYTPGLVLPALSGYDLRKILGR
jgi:hypothetical protein